MQIFYKLEKYFILILSFLDMTLEETGELTRDKEFFRRTVTKPMFRKGHGLQLDVFLGHGSMTQSVIITTF
uniref:Uncharacterized protein n=1 Tax=Arion vulgaris TaxID=1028688 RepID=A0A0B7AK61_9EUPU